MLKLSLFEHEIPHISFMSSDISNTVIFHCMLKCLCTASYIKFKKSILILF